MAKMPRYRTIHATLAAALLAASLGANAQSGTTTTPATGAGAGTGTSAGQGAATPARSNLERSDRTFLEKAALSGMAEAEMGQLAQQKATSPQVKDYAARMVQDHGKANSELMQLVSTKGLQIETDGRAHRKDAEKLGKLSGADFDREYMERMVKDHKRTVSEFEKASKSAKDPDVKTFAAKTLPTLQEHLTLAQTTHDAVKASARK